MTKKRNGSNDAETGCQGQADTEYEAGYGKPPKPSRFRPGQSGNPKGRPRGAKGFEAMLKRELDRKVPVTLNGRSTEISRSEAIMKRVAERALKGDLQAIRFIAEYDSKIAAKIAAKIEAQLKEVANEFRESAAGCGEAEILSHFAERARDGEWPPDDEGPDDEGPDDEGEE